MPFGRSLSATAGAQEPFSWWFPLAFIGMWLVVSTVLALIAGHMALLSRFPPVSMSAQERFLFASGSVRGVSFRSASPGRDLRESAHLAPNWLFRPITHRGIPCIPWGDLRCTRAQAGRGGWIPRASRFEIPRIGLRFELYGKPGRAVEAALQRTRAAPASFR